MNRLMLEKNVFSFNYYPSAVSLSLRRWGTHGEDACGEWQATLSFFLLLSKSSALWVAELDTEEEEGGRKRRREWRGGRSEAMKGRERRRVGTGEAKGTEETGTSWRGGKAREERVRTGGGGREGGSVGVAGITINMQII